MEKKGKYDIQVMQHHQLLLKMSLSGHSRRRFLSLYKSHVLPFPLCSFCCSQEGPSCFALILAA